VVSHAVKTNFLEAGWLWGWLGLLSGLLPLQYPFSPDCLDLGECGQLVHKLCVLFLGNHMGQRRVLGGNGNPQGGQLGIDFLVIEAGVVFLIVTVP